MKTKELRDKIADLILAEATPEEFVALFQSQLREVLGRVRPEYDFPSSHAGMSPDEMSRMAGAEVIVDIVNRRIDKELKKLDD